MNSFSPRAFAATVLLALIVPALVACSSAPTSSAAALPTAAVHAPTAQAVVAPTGLPPIANSALPTPTFLPYPTPLPQPPTPTMQPAGPGGLAFPLKNDKLNFGVAAHLFYTDRDTPLAMARDAGMGQAH